MGGVWWLVVCGGVSRERKERRGTLRRKSNCENEDEREQNSFLFPRPRPSPAMALLTPPHLTRPCRSVTSLGAYRAAVTAPRPLVAAIAPVRATNPGGQHGRARFAPQAVPAADAEEAPSKVRRAG